jgi:FixJ family two-component response regulator
MMQPGMTPEGKWVSNEPLVAIIDDDQPFRTALVEALASLGYATCDFASAEDFIAQGADATCDCVITDIHMPGMTGFDLKRLLTERNAALPVIMITARSEPGLEAEASATGAVCLLRKPFESSQLLHCLNRALNAP